MTADIKCNCIASTHDPYPDTLRPFDSPLAHQIDCRFFEFPAADDWVKSITEDMRQCWEVRYAGTQHFHLISVIGGGWKLTMGLRTPFDAFNQTRTHKTRFETLEDGQAQAIQTMREMKNLTTKYLGSTTPS